MISVQDSHRSGTAGGWWGSGTYLLYTSIYGEHCESNDPIIHSVASVTFCIYSFSQKRTAVDHRYKLVPTNCIILNLYRPVKNNNVSYFWFMFHLSIVLSRLGFVCRCRKFSRKCCLPFCKWSAFWSVSTRWDRLSTFDDPGEYTTCSCLRLGHVWGTLTVIFLTLQLFFYIFGSKYFFLSQNTVLIFRHSVIISDISLCPHVWLNCR